VLEFAEQRRFQVEKVGFLDLKALFAQHREEYLAAMTRVLENAAFIGGEEVLSFEKRFAQWIGGNVTAVGCANGTDAITLAAKALRLPSGSEAIMPAMTYVATGAALANAGFEIKLVDVTTGDWLMDPEKLVSAITGKTRLIAPVHLYGQMAEMDKIRQIADEHGCLVLEDAAQAHGATWKTKPIGHWGDVASYSFYPGKNLGAFGDAGAVVSRNGDYVQYCRALGNQGGLKKYDHDLVGMNSRLDNLQAAALNIKMKYIDGWNERRRTVAKQYRERLSGIPGLELPIEKTDARHVYHLYVVVVEDRLKLQDHLNRAGVESGFYYPKAMHQHRAFEKKFAGQRFPQAERIAAHGISLPMGPTLTDAEVERVTGAVLNFFGK